MEDDNPKLGADPIIPDAASENNPDTNLEAPLPIDPNSNPGPSANESPAECSGIPVTDEQIEKSEQDIGVLSDDDDIKLRWDENDEESKKHEEKDPEPLIPKTVSLETKISLNLLIKEADAETKLVGDCEISVNENVTIETFALDIDTSNDNSAIHSDPIHSSTIATNDVNDSIPSESVSNKSLDKKPEKQHGLLQPDQMIEIPTQELIDIDDSNNDDIYEDSIEDINKSTIIQTLDATKEPSEIKKESSDTVIVKETLEIPMEEDVILEKIKEIPVTSKNDDPEMADSEISDIDNNLCIDVTKSIDPSNINQSTNSIDQPTECLIEDQLEDKDTVQTVELANKPAITELASKGESPENNQLIVDQNNSDQEFKTVEHQSTIPDEPATVLESKVESLEANQHIDDPKDPNQLVQTVDLEQSNNETAVSETVELEPTLITNEPVMNVLGAKPESPKNNQLNKKSMDTTFETPDQDPDEVTELDDSLGLLAESSRVMDDDEDEDDGDDDDDYEPEDESSNQITAENSEDSNNHQSETDQPVNQLIDKTPSPTDGKAFDFPIEDINDREKIDSVMDVIECEEMEIPSPIANADTEKDREDGLNDVQESLEKQNELVNTTLVQSEGPIGEKAIDENLIEKDDQPSKESEKGTPTKGITVHTSPSKTKVLNISNTSQFVVNYVDLEESSSEDDVQLVKQNTDIDSTDVTSINLPKDIDVMSASAGNTSEIVTKDHDTVINVPKTQSTKIMPKLNTSELTIKTITNTESTLVIPEAKMNDVIIANQSEIIKKKSHLSLEIFNLDSDDDDIREPAISPPPPPSVPTPRYKCANPQCRASVTSSIQATPPVIHYYRLNNKKRPRVCEDCTLMVKQRQYTLVEGMKSFMPLMDLEMEIASEELVEISDSDSDEEGETQPEEKEIVGEDVAEYLKGNLADILNETWERYELDSRIEEAQNDILEDLNRLEKEGAEINAMFDECQIMTDKIRNELYATFEPNRKELLPIIIMDNNGIVECNRGVPAHTYSQMKRRPSPNSESASKRPAIPMEETDKNAEMKSDDIKDDDSQEDVSVVRLCAEVAPTNLPPVGELIRPPLKIGMTVFAMRNAFGSWSKAKILDVLGKGPPPNQQFTQCRVRFENKVKNPCKVLLARCLAYTEPSTVRLTIGTRVVALFKDEENLNREAFYSGVVAEVPTPVNNYRYLVFFDDGYAQYVQHDNTRLVAQCSPSVWDEVHPLSREFVYNYLRQYPERPMVRLHAGQKLKVELNGKWYTSPVMAVDASLVQVQFAAGRREWVYRGSSRLEPLYLELQAAERTRHRPLPRARHNLVNVPYVEYTRSDEQNKSAEIQTQKEQEEIRRQRAVAKKSTSTQQVPIAINNTAANVNANTITSRVVYYTPKNAVKPLKMVPHNCGPRCKRSDVLSLKDLRTYNPLAKPLLSGWERQIVRVRGLKEVMYRSPCGRRIRNMPELHKYLRMTRSDLPVDLFDFTPATHCLAEFVLNRCLVGKKDLSHGRENVPVPCVNYYDTTLPEFCSYSTERTPTDGVPLNLDPEFLCGCDCTDDCQDKSKCACWKMTLEGARTIGLGSDVGYVYRRLPEPLPSGIYECNSRCKCKNTCLNRVVQHPLQLKLQVFKTLKRGWGIRSLNDVPKGSFLCIYAGNLLTDATANLDGLNEGDEYLAELDYIEVVEQMKEGYEEDIPDEDKERDKKGSGKGSGSDSEGEMSSEEEQPEKENDDDDEFKPDVHYGPQLAENRVRERSSRRKKQEKEQAKEKKEKEKEKKEKGEDDCITISDDEEVREPSRFTAQAGIDHNEFKSKYKSVRAHFGKDEACYIMDAKVQGNIGRYLNHSCSPNVFVQNVFVDSHDPRFPWVAFFALTAVKAGSELTWNYNYDVGSVPGKMLYCFCGAPNCRGRLL